MARCESEENALVTCSLKSGDVESAKIPRAQCLILIDLFNAEDKELDFIGKLITGETYFPPLTNSSNIHYA